MSDFDIEFFFDPVCPFAWITSRWIVKVQEQTDYKVDWRFISLRILNKDKDYAADFPPEYEHGHTAGLRMLRVAAAVRADLGPEPVGALYTELSGSTFDAEPNEEYRLSLGTTEMLTGALERAGIPTSYAAAADDDSWDEIIEQETDLALSRTGRDVGTPIITFRPPDGLSFFGPVISRVPDDADAVPLWNAVTTLAAYPGFAELKRSLREKPHLRVFGALTDNLEFEDWQSGARAARLPENNTPDETTS
jgi:2-hydroxychromene-2-carboxylate isomerase